MGQRLHIGRMHGHHGIEKTGKTDAEGFGGALEVLGWNSKVPRTARYRKGNVLLIGTGSIRSRNSPSRL